MQHSSVLQKEIVGHSLCWSFCDARYIIVSVLWFLSMAVYRALSERFPCNSSEKQSVNVDNIYFPLLWNIYSSNIPAFSTTPIPSICLPPDAIILCLGYQNGWLQNILKCQSGRIIISSVNLVEELRTSLTRRKLLYIQADLLSHGFRELQK